MFASQRPTTAIYNTQDINDNDDLYTGYDTGNAFGNQRPPQTAQNPFTRMPTRSGLQTGRNDPSKRPMTSKRAAGYSSAGRPSTGKTFDPLNQGRPTSSKEEEVSEEETYRRLEAAIAKLLEESVSLTQNNLPFEGLEKAKEAAKKERLLTKKREQAGQQDQLNLDLTYVVLLNLAHMFEACNLGQEALNTYTIIVKKKAFNQAGRLRVNMGIIYSQQGKYNQAIKMYRMALDLVPAVNRNMRFKILRNVGIAFFKMGKYQDAITAFESIMENHPDHQSAYNLIICYFALGDKENMKRTYQKMASVNPPVIEQYTDNFAQKKDVITDNEVLAQDSLRQLSIDRKKKIERYVLLATKIIAPSIDTNLTSGYTWALDTIRSSPMAEIASELEITKAMQYVKMKEYQQAIEALKAYEKKGQGLVGTAATNISFLYFLEGEYKLAEKYSDVAIKEDRYNAKALNNRANCYFVRENYEKALEFYKSAYMSDSLCIEAIYNAGLTFKKMKDYESALSEFEKIHSMTRDNAEVIFQLADTHDTLGNFNECVEYLNILLSVVPTDPSVLARVGEIYSKDNDRTQAFHFYSEAYRYFPSNLAILTWLGTYYVECEVYEQAVQYFEKAALIQPYEPKWQLMIATCYRRSGNIKGAFEGYKQIHERFPDNTECLKFLIKMSNDMGLTEETVDFQQRLAKCEKQAAEKMEAKPPTPSPSTTSEARNLSRQSNRSSEEDKLRRSKSSIRQKSATTASRSTIDKIETELDVDVRDILPD